MTETRPQSPVEHWMALAGSIAGPVTVVSALLFYFGYVSSRAQYDYFGLDIDTVGLSTQDYIMRSPQPLLVPLLALIVLAAGLSVVHRAVRRRLRERDGAPAAARIAVRLGVGVLLAGLVLLFAYAWLGDWAYYALVTPLVLGSGAALVAYAGHVLRAATGEGSAPALAILLWLTVAACAFWATATVAQWSGLGLAREQARNLTDLPSVIIDTQEPLALPPGSSVAERELIPSGDGDTDARWRYQYFHLRLLIEGDDRLFVVPDVWSNRNTTLLVPLDGSVRVQFQFRNLAP